MVSFIVHCKLLFRSERSVAGVTFDDALLMAVNFDHVLHLLDVFREKLVAIRTFVPFVVSQVHVLLVDVHLFPCVVHLVTKVAFEDANFMSDKMGSQRGFVDKSRVTIIAYVISVMHAHVPLHLLETVESTIADDARENVALKFERQYLIFDVFIKRFIVFSFHVLYKQFECVYFTRAYHATQGRYV